MTVFAKRDFKSKKEQTFSIRSAEPADAARILEMVKAVMAEGIYTLSEPDELDQTVVQEADWIQKHIDHPSKVVLVAEVEGRLVGMLNFANGHRRRIAHHGEFGLSLDPEWREQGLGAAMIKALIDWATENPTIEKIDLRVHATNQRAIALYEKFGFIHEGLQKKDLKLGPNHYVDTVLMGRFVK